jgi:hypothetical protein
MGSIDVDGAAILRAILENPSAFPDVSTEINKAAQTLVTIQLKATSTNLGKVREIYRVIGDKPLALILDGLADTFVKSLTKKLDTNCAEPTKKPPHWHRGHILKLASGEVEPAAKSEPTKPAATKKGGSGKKPTLTPQEMEAKKKLTAASIKLGTARELRHEIGESSFKIIVNNMTEKMVATLARRLDRDHPELTTASTDWIRDHIAALAAGTSEPRSILESEAMSAKRVKPSAPR